MKITIETPKRKPNTCGTCKHTDNDLGFFSLRCDLLEGEKNDWGKVRSWEKCQFKPSRYIPQDIKKHSKRQGSGE